MTAATRQTPPASTAITSPADRSAIDISRRVLTWFDRHGRKHLPWQQDINPYRVWVSEIMLQQTQVSTVIAYFQRFMETLPTVEALAQASEDQVLHLWTGLGYYSRARNLHKTAKIICETMNGRFPDTVEALGALPGIGRSTAGAIVAIAFKKPAAILDGNVKRVLARYHTVAGWPGQSAVHDQLWHYAEAHLPRRRIADYTQAMMDLGATLCTRSRPACALCPLTDDCRARAQGNTQDYPGKKPPKSLPVKTTQMLIIRNADGEILLEKRPPTGIWGGLWGFPQVEEAPQVAPFLEQQLGITSAQPQPWQTYRHTFSHYHLDITPVLISLNGTADRIMENGRQLWYNLQQPAEIGLAAPVKKLLEKLT